MCFRPEWMVVGVVALAVTGCKPSDSSADTSPPPMPAKKYDYTPKALAGLPDVVQVPDSGQLKKLYVATAAKYGPSRADPFSLTRDETEYETSQTSLRLFNQVGGFSNEYRPFEPPEVIPVLEPQPYRRLSGVVVGDSVLAIIDMGDGQEAQIIRPGEHIPGTEWTVVSIDQEKAILRRDGNRYPKEITVRLETPPPGFAGPQAGGGAYPGGTPPGVPPGGPPPGTFGGAGGGGARE